MKTFVALTLLSSISIAANAGAQLDRIKTTGNIVIGFREASAPLSYIDADKRPIGYTIDICNKIVDAIQKDLGLKTISKTYIPVVPANRIETIATGIADLECGSTTNTQDRREKVAFAIPHFMTGTKYLVRHDSYINDLNDFRFKKLASIKGTAPMKGIVSANAGRSININISEVTDNTNGVLQVLNGKVDGYAMDEVLLYGLKVKHSDPDALKIVGKFLTIDAIAIMLSKNDKELKAIVDGSIRNLIYSKEIYAIYDKWFLKPIPPNNIALNLKLNLILNP